MLKSFAERLLLAYGLGTPYHAGKWRIIESAYHRLGLSKLYQNGAVEAERQGLMWRLNPVSLVQRSLYFLGVYEIHETRWLLSEVKPDWTVLDVGANFGYYSLLIAKASEGTATIHAFEPASTVFATLKANAEANGYANFHPHAMALSNQDAELELVMPPAGNEGIGHLRGREDGPVQGRVEKIKAMRMDTFARQEGLKRLDFIKIDVEGAESLVLEGARETIARFKPRLLVEINPGALAGFGVSADWLIEQIRSQGYDLFRLERAQLKPLTEASGIGDYVNAICLPR
jgi:FkbM family methyltransferase